MRGNPGQYPIPNEPQPAQLAQVPKPPPWLSSHGADQWWIIATELHRLGLLTKIDEPLLAAYCAAYGRWYEAEEALALYQIGQIVGDEKKPGQPTLTQLMGFAHQATTQMLRLASEYGLTPVARARLGTPNDPSAKSKFGGLLATG